MESAQRFMLKGQLDKAIKDYQQVVALEPKETRYRQKLAELLVRDNRKEEAIAEYADIGKHYAENSYFLKAIAVYKQIQRLSPGNTEISLLLASLNHKQGLIGNALAEYGQVVAQLEKTGAFSNAVKIIEQMLSIDGEQVSIRLKHAELLFASGAEDTSYHAFRSLVNSLRERGDAEGVRQVTEKMTKLFPNVADQNLERLSAQIEGGELDQAVAALQQWLKRDGRDLQAWQLLCEAQRRKGDVAAARLSHRQMMELFPDSLGVVKGAIRCELQAGESDKANALLERHLPRFIERGESLTAEELLQGVPAAVADQLKDTDWLKKFYQPSGAPVAAGSAEAPSAFPSELDPGAMELELPNELPFELPDAFGSESGGEAAEPAPASAPDLTNTFASPWESEPAAAPAKGQDLPLPWEEEIPLDLDGDFEAALPAPEEELPLELPDFAPDAAPSAPEQQDSLNDLSFLSEGAPPLEVDFGGDSSEASVELALPDDSEAFPDFDWSQEPEEAAAVEPAVELDHFVDLEAFGDPEELPELEHLEEVPELDPVEHLEEVAELEPVEPVHELAELDPVEHMEEVAELEPVEHLHELVELDPIEHLEEVAEEAVDEAEEAAATAGAPVLQDLLAPEPDDLPAPPAVEPAAVQRPLRGWEEIYPEALPAESAVDPNDLYELESHYDLGLGYKEMGMYEGAIKELNVAAINPQRRLACLTLQAMCYREKGDPDKARELLQGGLDLDVLTEEERVTLSYELAALHESSGELDDAIRMYRQVQRANPAFGDVGNRLFQLTGEEPLDIIELEEADL